MMLAGLILVTGCQPKRATITEGGSPSSEADTVRFDPFELPQDRQVVPDLFPVNAAVKGRETIEVDESVPLAADTTAGAADAATAVQVDTLNHQAFRVQVFTSKLFGEAQHVKRVAEEIFDRPVYLDYEVPYYKVRVGSFGDRYDAEDYAQRVRVAGYPDAWVVATTVNIRQAAPLYEDAPLPPSKDSTAAPGTSSGDQEPDGGE